MRKIAIDIDGTLATIDEKFFDPIHIGMPFEHAVHFTQELKKNGYYIILHTCRTNAELNKGNGIATPYVVKVIKNWCKLNNIEFDEIWTGEGKPYADWYVDDRAIYCNPEKDQNAYAGVLGGLIK